MKIIYKYKGNIKKGEIEVSYDTFPFLEVSNSSSPFLLLGEDQGSFLEFCAVFAIMAPYPKENNNPIPIPMEQFSTFNVESLQVQSEVQPGVPFEVQPNEVQDRDYVELITLCGFDSEGFFKIRVPQIEFEPPQMETPTLNYRSSTAPLNSIANENFNIEDLELVYDDARFLLRFLDPRIKVEDIVVTPVKNNITILPDNSNPLNEDNIYSHLEDYNVQGCSTLRVAKPPGFGCIPTDLVYNVIREEEGPVGVYRTPSLDSESSLNRLEVSSVPVVGNSLPDYSFGVIAKYKINDGPWLTYQRTVEDETEELPSNEFESEPYNYISWDRHVYNFFMSIKDLEGRRIFSYQGNGGEYVPFEIAESWNSNTAVIKGAELDFDNIDEPYYPPPVDMVFEEEGFLEELEAVDRNRQTTVYFQVTRESGRLADIINTIFGKDEEVRSCCYTTWPGY